MKSPVIPGFIDCTRAATSLQNTSTYPAHCRAESLRLSCTPSRCCPPRGMERIRAARLRRSSCDQRVYEWRSAGLEEECEMILDSPFLAAKTWLVLNPQRKVTKKSIVSLFQRAHRVSVWCASGLEDIWQSDKAGRDTERQVLR
jgi:hypothetical protein